MWFEVAVDSKIGGTRHVTCCAPANVDYVANSWWMVWRCVVLGSETLLHASDACLQQMCTSNTGMRIAWTASSWVDHEKCSSMGLMHAVFPLAKKACRRGSITEVSIRVPSGISCSIYSLSKWNQEKQCHISYMQTFYVADVFLSCILFDESES